MKVNDFIAVRFPQEENKPYYAIVTKELPDNRFECKFVHSGSIYIFELKSGWLEVVKTSGAFKVGSRTNKVLTFTETDQFPLSANGNVRVTFDDANAYLGSVSALSPMTTVRFLHSGNTYSIDENNVAHKPGGTYDGRRVLEIKVYGQGKNLFSGSHESSISLSINDDFNTPLSGEFDVKIKRTDTDVLVYENTLSADDSTANDGIALVLSEGQNLIIIIDFHPSIEPYTSHPISTSQKDRDTSIIGSKTFVYKKIQELHFDIVLQNEVSEISTTSGTEAIKTIQEEVSRAESVEDSTSNSHTFQTKLGGEASIELFGIKGNLDGGGEVSDTDGASRSRTTSKEVFEGESSSIGDTQQVTKTYKVYYPKGLKIFPTFN